MIDGLKRNIETEIEMLREISNYSRRMEFSDDYEKKLLGGAIKSLKESLKIINNSIPEILKDISPNNKLPSSGKLKKEKDIFEKIEIKRVDSKVGVVLNTKSKEEFLKELSISEGLIRKLKKKGFNKKEDYEEFKASRGYLKLANKIFLNAANNAVEKEKFKSLSVELRKANVDVLFKSYIALIYFSVFLSFFVSVFLILFLLFFSVGTSWPFFSFYEGDSLIRFLKVSWIVVALPAVTFLALYYYPATEKKAIGSRLNQELPFAVIHMSAISGSGIEPSEIFRIIGLSKEYPYLRREIRKVLNQINLYGYDLTTALINAAKTAPSENLAELFSGLATSINSGASLPGFFEKRAESLLLEYRLEREKYTRVVETFLDIYISVVIAAPMIFLLLLVMMTISGIQVGFTSVQLSIVGVLGIGILNFFFIVFLQLKQPGY